MELFERQPPPPRPRIPERQGFIREVAETLLLIIGIYTLVNLATARFVVEGLSMFPSFEGGEFLIVSRLDYILGDPQRGDIVVFHYPDNPERDFIKRVIALPGETINIVEGQVYINGVPIEEPYIKEVCRSAACRSLERTLGADEYFVMGDNRNASQDSTTIGPIPRSHIIGRAWIIYWELDEIGVISHHNYDHVPEDAPPLLTVEPVPTPVPIPTIVEPPMQGNTGG